MESLNNPLFIILVSCGIIFILMAIITSKYPPKKINKIYGYRTKRSMKSKERWDFAQKASSDLMQKYGIWMTVIGFAGYFIPLDLLSSTLVGSTVLIVLTFGMANQTERAIKEKFGDD